MFLENIEELTALSRITGKIKKEEIPEPWGFL
jgi:hypothetical protein